MSEIGLALVALSDTEPEFGIYKTPRNSCLEYQTEVKVEGFGVGGAIRGTVVSYVDVDQKSKCYDFINAMQHVFTNTGIKKVVSVIRENPLEWEE